MKRPLRPHNYYGGTTCPGRVTGQVDTIRGLIPEEDDMPLTQDEFNEMFKLAALRVGVPRLGEDGKPSSEPEHPLAAWLRAFQRHRRDDELHGSAASDYTNADAVEAVRDKLSTP